MNWIIERGDCTRRMMVIDYSTILFLVCSQQIVNRSRNIWQPSTTSRSNDRTMVNLLTFSMVMALKREQQLVTATGLPVESFLKYCAFLA